MGVASELLYSAGKRPNPDDTQGQSIAPIQRLQALNPIVYALVAEHEPPEYTEARLRSDLTIMHLSGLASEGSDLVVTRVCQQAAAIMAEFVRLIPKSR
jgi:hypothetical protein